MRKQKVTTDSNHKFNVAPNLLGRNFTAGGPNQKWAGDITYIWTREGWLYLAVILDLHSRRVIGWAVSNRMKRLRRSSKPSLSSNGSIRLSCSARPSWSGATHGRHAVRLRWPSLSISKASTIRDAVTQHWVGKAPSLSNGRWL